MKKVQTKITKVYEVDGVVYPNINDANVAIAIAEISDLIGSIDVAKQLVEKASDADKRETLIKALKLLKVKKPLAPRKKVVKADAKTKTTKV